MRKSSRGEHEVNKLLFRIILRVVSLIIHIYNRNSNNIIAAQVPGNCVPETVFQSSRVTVPGVGSNRRPHLSYVLRHLLARLTRRRAATTQFTCEDTLGLWVGT